MLRHVGLILLAISAGAGAQEPARWALSPDPSLAITVKSVRVIPNPIPAPDRGGKDETVWAVELEGVEKSGADEFSIAPDRTRIVDGEGRVLTRMSFVQSFSRQRAQPQDPWTFTTELYFPVPAAGGAEPPLTGAGGPAPAAGGARLLVVEMDRYKILKSSFDWEGNLQFPLAGASPGLQFQLEAPTLAPANAGEKPQLSMRFAYQNLVTNDRVRAPFVGSLKLYTTDGRTLTPEATGGDLGQTRLEGGMVLQHGVLTERFLDQETVPQLRKVEIEVWRYAPWEEAWTSLPEAMPGG